jgi:hypothetical protein
LRAVTACKYRPSFRFGQARPAWSSRFRSVAGSAHPSALAVALVPTPRPPAVVTG